MLFRSLAVTFSLLLSLAAGEGCATEPGRSSEVAARAARRQEIAATPLLERPNRPFHIYGNTVRRAYSRGIPSPSPRDAMGASRER